MANIEKHPKHPMEQIDQADFSQVPTCGRSPHLVGQYIKNRQNRGRRHVPQMEERKRAIILRLEDVPATPRNLERIRERIRLLNQRLAESGAQFRLRVV
jgi:hypothetical protein